MSVGSGARVSAYERESAWQFIDAEFPCRNVQGTMKTFDIKEVKSIFFISSKNALQYIPPLSHVGFYCPDEHSGVETW